MLDQTEDKQDRSKQEKNKQLLPGIVLSVAEERGCL